MDKNKQKKPLRRSRKIYISDKKYLSILLPYLALSFYIACQWRTGSRRNLKYYEATLSWLLGYCTNYEM